MRPPWRARVRSLMKAAANRATTLPSKPLDSAIAPVGSQRQRRTLIRRVGITAFRQTTTALRGRGGERGKTTKNKMPLCRQYDKVYKSNKHKHKPRPHCKHRRVNLSAASPSRTISDKDHGVNRRLRKNAYIYSMRGSPAHAQRLSSIRSMPCQSAVPSPRR